MKMLAKVDCLRKANPLMQGLEPRPVAEAMAQLHTGLQIALGISLGNSVMRDLLLLIEAVENERGGH